MQLTCQHCGEAIHPRDVDFEALQARCRHCGWAFGKADSPYRRGQASPTKPDDEPDNPKPGLPRPAYFDVEERGDAVTIAYRKHLPGSYKTWSVLTLVPVLAIGAAVEHLTRSMGLAVAVATMTAFLLGFALVVILSPRRLQLDARWLRITHGPFELKRIRRTEIDQLCVIERPTDVSVRYHLAAYVLGDVEPVLHVRSALDGLYLEQELERRLDLPDRPVPGDIFGGP